MTNTNSNTGTNQTHFTEWFTDHVNKGADIIHALKDCSGYHGHEGHFADCLDSYEYLLGRVNRLLGDIHRTAFAWHMNHSPMGRSHTQPIVRLDIRFPLGLSLGHLDAKRQRDAFNNHQGVYPIPWPPQVVWTPTVALNFRPVYRAALVLRALVEGMITEIRNAAGTARMAWKEHIGYEVEGAE